MKPAAAQNLGLTPGEITLVITDLQGSTELWEWNSAVMDVANALHAQLARRLLKKYCGYEVHRNVCMMHRRSPEIEGPAAQCPAAAASKAAFKGAARCESSTQW